MTSSASLRLGSCQMFPTPHSFVKLRNYQETINGRSEHEGAIKTLNSSILQARLTLPGSYTDTVSIQFETTEQRVLNVCIYKAPKTVRIDCV